jgi:formylglycine-generating enzyme required for sulfatase activity
MRRLIVNLQQFEPGIDAEQIADILWLAQQMTIDADIDSFSISSDGALIAEEAGEVQENPPPVTNAEFVDRLAQGEEPRDTAGLSVADDVSDEDDAIEDSEPITSDDVVPEKPAGIPIRAAAARSLRRPIELERALRPLMRKVPSRSRYILDEVATAEKFAETRVKSPVVKAEAQRWLDLAVVVEETSLTEIWRQTIDEFQVLLEHLGAFRDVRVWTMRRGDNQQLELFPRHHRRTKQQRSHGFKELIDPSGQRLILVLSDCTSVAWWGGQVHDWLKAWSAVNLVTVMQLLPQRMWRQGVLGEGLSVQLRSRQPVVRNAQWEVEGLPVWRQYVESPRSRRVVATFPVVTLEPSSLQQWARAVAGSGEFATVGVLFEEGWRSEVLPTVATSQEAPSIDAKEIVSQFRSVASPMARRLANLMAVAPLNLRVIELIQEKLLPDSRQMHVAEVFLGGLLVRQVNELGKGWFQFRPGVRRDLRQSLSKPETMQVLEKVSEYITARLGIPMRSFSAFLSAEDLPEEIQGDEDVVAFAEVALDSLRQMGGQYAVFAEQVSSKIDDRQVSKVHDVSRVLELILRYEEAIKRKVIEQFSDGNYEYTTDMSPEDEMIDNVDTSDIVLDLNRPIRMDIDYTSIRESNIEVLLGEEISIYGLIADINFSVEASLFDDEQYISEIHEDGLPTYTTGLGNQVTSITVDLVFWPTDGEFEIDSTIDVEQPIVLAWSPFSENDRQIEDPIIPQLSTFEFEYGEYEEVDTTPQLQTFEFDILTFATESADNPEPDPLAALDWQRVSFTVATIDPKLTIDPNQKSKLLTSDHVAWMYTAETEATRRSLRTLRRGPIVQFEMIAVPEGTFFMGSDENSREKPIRKVKVLPFFMGKYLVTQKQWASVAQMPRVQRDLKPTPSNFKGDGRPVEQVSWLEAIEFCSRLSQHMGREYRLPTEAEWEYACRAGTTTKYHFGDEITSELANYENSNSGTTPIGQFPYVNAFGLSDMHGNVQEWCMDHWHDSYQSAPIYGTAWIDARAKENAQRVLRGGSWNNFSASCRSASRHWLAADNRYNNFGFRLVSPASILL